MEIDTIKKDVGMSWEFIKLSNVAETSSGGTPNRSNEKFWTNGNIPWIKSGQLKDCLITNAEEFITEEGLRNSSAKYFKKGTLLLAMYGATAGKLGFLGLDATTNQAICSITPKSDNLDTRYLFYYLLSIRNEIIRDSTGGAQPNIGQNYINEIQIPLPPLATQKRIAEILDAADVLRRKDQELLNKYDELAQAIFIDMFGDPVKNEKGWDISKLGDCCGIGSSVRVFVEELVAEGIPFLRGQEIGAMSAGEQVEPSLFITEDHYDRLKAQGGVPKIGDLLMPSICPDGRIFQVTTEDPFYFKDGRVLWVKVNENNFDSTFLKFLLKEKFLRNYTNIASGTTFAELKIFALKDLELIVPSITLQKKFAQLINLTFNQLQLSRRESDNAKSLFNSLIQKAFKGELVA